MQVFLLIVWLAVLAGGCFASVYFLKKLGLYQDQQQ